MIKYINLKKRSFHEIDLVIKFLWKRKDLNKKTLFKRLVKAKSMVIGKEKNKIIGFGCLKKPGKKTKEMLKKLNITNKNIIESGFFYINPGYRGHGIGSKIQEKLLKNNISCPIISITKTTNIIMQKILQNFGFTPIGKQYINNFLQEKVQIYIRKLTKKEKELK